MVSWKQFALSLAFAASCAATALARGFQTPRSNPPVPSVREGILVEFSSQNLEDDWTIRALPEASQDVIDDAHKLHEKIVEHVLSDEGFASFRTQTSPNGRSLLVTVIYRRRITADEGKKVVQTEYSALVWRDWRSPEEFFTLEGQWEFLSNKHVGMIERRKVVRRGAIDGAKKRRIRSLDDPETEWTLDWSAAVADDGSVAFRESEHSRDYVIVIGKLDSDGSFKEEVRYTRNQIDRSNPPNLLAWLNGGEYLLITVGQIQEGWGGSAFIRVLDRNRKLLRIKLRDVAYPRFILSGRNFLVIRKDEAELYSITKQERVKHQGSQRGYGHDRHRYDCSPSGDLALLQYAGSTLKNMLTGVYQLDRFDRGPIERFGNVYRFQGWLTWDAP